MGVKLFYLVSANNGVTEEPNEGLITVGKQDLSPVACLSPQYSWSDHTLGRQQECQGLSPRIQLSMDLDAD